MICPACKSEYQSEITMCADCNIPLVTLEELSEQKQKQASGEQIGNFEIIFSTPNFEEATTVKNSLEAHDIWPLILSEAEIKFYVHTEQKKKALDALKDYREASQAEDIATGNEPNPETTVLESSNKEACSICGNSYRPKSNFCDQCGQPLTTI